jgi:hypothetical protein
MLLVLVVVALNIKSVVAAKFFMMTDKFGKSEAYQGN